MSISTLKGKLFFSLVITGTRPYEIADRLWNMYCSKKVGWGAVPFVLLSPFIFVIITTSKLYQLALWLKSYIN